MRNLGTVTGFDDWSGVPNVSQREHHIGFNPVNVVVHGRGSTHESVPSIRTTSVDQRPALFVLEVLTVVVPAHDIDLVAPLNEASNELP